MQLYFFLTSGATVYIVCRNAEKGEAAVSEMQTKTGNPNIHLEVYYLV